MNGGRIVLADEPGLVVPRVAPGLPAELPAGPTLRAPKRNLPPPTIGLYKALGGGWKMAWIGSTGGVAEISGRSDIDWRYVRQRTERFGQDD